MRRLFVCLAVASLALAPAWLKAGQEEDQALVDQVKSKLVETSKAGKLKGWQIKAQAKDGVVWLSGTVRNNQQMEVALDAVQDVPGIQRIMNGLSAGGNDTAVRQTAGDSSGPQAQLAVGAQASESPKQKSVVATSHQQQAPLPLGPAGARVPRMQGGMQVGAMQEGAPNASPIPAYVPAGNGNVAPAHFDRPHMPGYAWPSYASYPNYAAVTYPRQYSPTAWPFIGPFYPYPQVPLGWRKVSLEWHNGWWMLDFNDGCGSSCY